MIQQRRMRREEEREDPSDINYIFYYSYNYLGSHNLQLPRCKMLCNCLVYLRDLIHTQRNFALKKQITEDKLLLKG